MKNRRWIWVLAAVATALVILRLGASPDPIEVGVTRELAGVWTTSDARYPGRFLKISPDEVVFGQGEVGEERRRLVGVYREGSSENPLYVLRYTLDDEGESVADLRVHLHEGVLRFASQPEVAWAR